MSNAEAGQRESLAAQEARRALYLATATLAALLLEWLVAETLLHGPTLARPLNRGPLQLSAAVFYGWANMAPVALLAFGWLNHNSRNSHSIRLAVLMILTLGVARLAIFHASLAAVRGPYPFSGGSFFPNFTIRLIYLTAGQLLLFAPLATTLASRPAYGPSVYRRLITRTRWTAVLLFLGLLVAGDVLLPMLNWRAYFSESSTVSAFIGLFGCLATGGGAFTLLCLILASSTARRLPRLLWLFSGIVMAYAAGIVLFATFTAPPSQLAALIAWCATQAVPVVGIGALAAAEALAWRRTLRELPRLGICPACGYDVAASAIARCPECGLPVPEADGTETDPTAAPP